MSRNFDNWNRYLDNKSNPLHGCIMFNVKDGNTIAPIYDVDGTALENPILTDEYGRTQHQVFIDVDVVAYFYKYIGEGTYTTQTDIDINDDTKWSLQYTSENVNDTGFSISSDYAICVNTIADLRALDVDMVPEVSGVKAVTLLGYFEAGDKEPVMYIWHDSSTTNDDNGSIIKSNDRLNGRWYMVKPTEHCDCKHFGIFTANSTTNITDSTTRIGQLVDYCNANKIRPYFSGEGDYKYIRYSNLNISVPEIDVAEGVEFADYGTSYITAEFNGKPYFKNALTNITSLKAKTSWNAYLISGAKEVIIDDVSKLYTTYFSNCDVYINASLTKAVTFENCRVYCNASVSSISIFNKCQIFSSRQINSGCYFVGCELDENMFYGQPYIHIDNTCIIPLDSFKNKLDMWLRLKGQQNCIYYDWQGVLTTTQPYTNVVDTSRTVINWKYAGSGAAKLVESNNSQTYTFENCTGNIELQGKAANNYIFKDCEVIVSFADGYNTGCTLSAMNSTINIASTRVNLAALSTRDSSLITTTTGSIDAATANLYSSNIIIPLYAGVAVVKDCDIDNNIQLYGTDISTPLVITTPTGTTYNVTRIITGNILNNKVNGKIILGTSDASDPHITTVDLVRNLSIVNNVGLSQDPIEVKRSFTSIYEENNTYVYENNSGTFINGKSSFTLDMSACASADVGSCTIYTFEGAMTADGVTDVDTYLAEFDMFTIGTQGVTVKMTTYPENAKIQTSNPNKVRFNVIGSTVVLDQMERTKAEWQVEQTSYFWPRCLSFSNGFKWRITRCPTFLTEYGTNMFGNVDGIKIYLEAEKV